MANTSDAATFTGLGAIAIWSCSALLLSELADVPPFLILTALFGGSALIILGKITLTGQWQRLHQPLRLWVLGSLFIAWNYIAYVFAFKYAPPAQIDLISYSWPTLLVLGLMCVPGKHPPKYTLRIALLGVLGLICLLKPYNTTVWTAGQLLGWGLALSAAGMWTGYVLLVQRYKTCPPDMMGGFALVGWVASLALHTTLEPSVTLATKEIVLLAVLGGLAGPALCAWDYGIKHGHTTLLSISTYCIPLFSITLLIIFGRASFEFSLIMAAILITLTGVLATRVLR